MNLRVEQVKAGSSIDYSAKTCLDINVGRVSANKIALTIYVVDIERVDKWIVGLGGLLQTVVGGTGHEGAGCTTLLA